MRTLRLDVQYDGTDFSGWQRQRRGLRTVQGVLEESATKILHEKVIVRGAGRTDAGVHALGQVASITTSSSLKCPRLLAAFRGVLPPDVAVTKVSEADPDFHPICSAKSKTYRYLVMTGPASSPFWGRYTWFLPIGLDVAAMRRGGKALIGERDFTSFCASAGKRKSPVRNLQRLEILHRGNMIHFILEADGFLYHMVRNIVGTLIAVGRGKIPAGEVKAILNARDRKRAGMTAPAGGLFLVRVNY